MPFCRPVLPRALAAVFCTLVGLLPTLAAAQNGPVVVELYTSQGCSSCPPADALLHKLAAREDVIALALHVDYWDYIGWKDAFARPEHAERQRGYARSSGRGSVYTPQMIINGMDSIVGARGMEISEAITAHKGRQTGVGLAIARSGDVLKITAELRAGAAPGDMDVVLLRYTPLRDVMITRGENAGHHMSYANVVETWRRLAQWSGAAPLSVETEVAGDAPLVVLVQGAEYGPIMAAARLR